MAKSNKRIDEETIAVSDIWNKMDTTMESRKNEICSAIYWTLKWARGGLSASPSEQLLRRLKEPRNA